MASFPSVKGRLDPGGSDGFVTILTNLLLCDPIGDLLPERHEHFVKSERSTSL